MPDTFGMFFTVIGIVLVVTSSFVLVVIARLKGIVANGLAFGVITFATVVLLAQVLSEFHLVSRAGFLLGHLIIAAIVLGWGIKSDRLRLNTVHFTFSNQEIDFRRWVRHHPALALLSICVMGAMLLGAYLIMVVPPNIWDSLFVNLSKVVIWLENGTLRHFQTNILKKIVFPINAEIGLLWSIAFWGNDRLGGFIQWFATIFTMMGIYGIARQLKFSRPAGLFAALMWSTFTIVVLQSTSTKNDTLVAFFIVVAFYFLLAGLRDRKSNHNVNFILFGLSIGLAAGTKPLVVMLMPGLALMAGILIFYRPREFFSKFLYAALWSAIGFTLLGSYNYILNWLDFHSITGPPEISAEHTVQNYSLALFKTNLAQIVYYFFDPGGLPDSVVDIVQQWRPGIGRIISSQLVPDALETGFSFDDARQIVPREDGAWFGPLGILLFWPVVLFYLFIVPFTHKSRNSFFQEDFWKWSIAFVTTSFVFVFALLFRWNPWIGRMFIIAVAFGAPLLAGFYEWSEKYRLLRWAVVILAVIVLGWSSTHNYHKPILGAKTIWAMDYYDLRTIQEPEMAAIYRYVDANVPLDASLGLAGQWPANRWDYLFVGPNITRNYTYLGNIPQRVTLELFVNSKVDYIILAVQPSQIIDSETPLWPIGSAWGLSWFLVRRSEAELVAHQPCQTNFQPESFGAGYSTYLEIKKTLEQDSSSFRALTTDFRMPCYERDRRFVFDVPDNEGQLATFTHLVVTSEDNYRLGIPLQLFRDSLKQRGVIEEMFSVNGYGVYRIAELR